MPPIVFCGNDSEAKGVILFIFAPIAAAWSHVTNSLECIVLQNYTLRAYHASDCIFGWNDSEAKGVIVFTQSV